MLTKYSFPIKGPGAFHSNSPDGRFVLIPVPSSPLLFTIVVTIPTAVWIADTTFAHPAGFWLLSPSAVIVRSFNWKTVVIPDWNDLGGVELLTISCA